VVAVTRVAEEVAIPEEAAAILEAVNPEDKAAAKNTTNPHPPMTSSF
jgi:hypothetical protein